MPALVVGNAGTVRTGAFDDLGSLADMARREGLWLHVDGAFGALAALAPGLAALTVGMERADSLAVDLHKWLHVPIDAGCILVRDAAAHRTTFGITGPYVGDLGAGVAVATNRFTDLGLQQTRSARGLKVWLSLKEHGVRAFGRMIQKNVDQARHLAALVHATDRLELLAPVPLNIVCFRYRRPGLPGEALNDLNRRILIALQERGIAVPSHTLIGERFALRCAITNHRSRAEDFEVLVRAVVDIGDELAAAS
jgi:glutamate/tyrosine decarboxylase-like PLP-dependent enzyme